MQIIRLIREVNDSAPYGPTQGQYTLQKALRAAAPEWLEIGGSLRQGEVPWFWCWRDRSEAVQMARRNEPFIHGPNILFNNSARPCQVPAEREICQAASCRLIFTESEWYRELIRAHLPAENPPPIVLWPYPIEPKPLGPVAAEFDLLIYAKRGYDLRLVQQLTERYRAKTLRYREYRREELLDCARRSRCCVYLSDDDRGPLALAEILLAGCPAVGVPRGAPWIKERLTGQFFVTLRLDELAAAVEEILAQPERREDVRTIALEQFDTRKTIEAILTALAQVAGQG
jgi:hypothetical protein